MKKQLLFLSFILFYTAPLFSQVVYLNEPFTATTLPVGWTNNDIAGNGEIWHFNNPGGRNINAPVSGNFAIFDSDYGGWSSPAEEATLESPAFDATGQSKVILQFDHYFNSYTTDHYYVEIFNGVSWVIVLDGTNDTANAISEFIDISAQAAGVSNARVRFRYVGDWDWYWAVDNVFIYSPPNNDNCTTATNLTVGTVFNDFAITETSYLSTNSLHVSNPGVDPSCGSFGNGYDLWYTLTIPASGNVAIETRNQPGTAADDTVLSAYAGTCGSLTEISCSLNDGDMLYSRVMLTGRTPGETIYIRAFENGNNAIMDYEIAAFTCYREPIKWDGSNWRLISNDNIVTPVIDLKRETRIEGNYDTATNGSFSTCTCEITTGNTLAINANNYVEIDKDLINNGTININNNGSLVQVQNNATISGSGAYTMQRNSTTINDIFDYTYWSSPMSSHTLGNMLTTTNYYRFDASIQNWVQKNSATNMTPGVGYISRPTTGTASGSSFTANFSGAPYNTGTITTAMQFTTVNGTPADDSWNLIGNPYPSAIDANALIDHNPTMNGTLYFWSHVTPLNPSGTSYASSDYATWNRTGSVGTASTSTATGNGNTNAPTGMIAAGQSFFAQANTTGNIEFTNAMRVTTGNDNFYRTQENNSDRVWLNLTNPQGIFKQQLIGFLADATDGFDRLYDGNVNNGNGYINFYSIMDNEKFAILANDLIDTEDIIPLGYESTIVSTFSIAIDHLSGALDTDEFDVFIKDLDLNIIHNLKESPYQFDTTIGVFDNRFELFIQRSSALTINNSAQNNSILIINQNSQGTFTLQTNNEDVISEVLVYNSLGQLITKYTGEETQVNLDLEPLKKGKLLIFKVNTITNKQFTKKILKN